MDGSPYYYNIFTKMTSQASPSMIGDAVLKDIKEEIKPVRNSLFELLPSELLKQSVHLTEKSCYDLFFPFELNNMDYFNRVLDILCDSIKSRVLQISARELSPSGPYGDIHIINDNDALSLLRHITGDIFAKSDKLRADEVRQTFIAELQLSDTKQQQFIQSCRYFLDQSRCLRWSSANGRLCDEMPGYEALKVLLDCFAVARSALPYKRLEALNNLHGAHRQHKERRMQQLGWQWTSNDAEVDEAPQFETNLLKEAEELKEMMDRWLQPPAQAHTQFLYRLHMWVSGLGSSKYQLIEDGEKILDLKTSLGKIAEADMIRAQPTDGGNGFARLDAMRGTCCRARAVLSAMYQLDLLELVNENVEITSRLRKLIVDIRKQADRLDAILSSKVIVVIDVTDIPDLSTVLRSLPEDGRSLWTLLLETRNDRLLNYLCGLGEIDRQLHCAGEFSEEMSWEAEALLKGGFLLTELVLSRLCPVNQRGQNGETALLIAAQEGNVELVRLLLERQADSRLRNKDGRSPLFLAKRSGPPAMVYLLSSPLVESATGDLGEVSQLIEDGADVDFVDEDGFTALMKAASEGNVGVVECLINSGANTSIRSKSGKTALQLARAAGHDDVVRKLSFRITGAVESGKMEEVVALLDEGADVNYADEDGNTSLMLAATRGYSDIVRLLVLSKARCLLRNKRSKTALSLAFANGHACIVYTLSFSLIEAAEFGNLFEMDRLLDEGAFINYIDASGNTALIVAASQGFGHIVKSLVSRRADLSFKTKDGKTALQLAQEKGHTEVANLLSTVLVKAASSGNVTDVLRALSDGANVNYLDEEGDSALMKAAERGHLDVARLLIQHKANSSIINTAGKTALAIAKEKGHISIVNLFPSLMMIEAVPFGNALEVVRRLDEGADIDFTDADGNTALIIAAAMNQTDIAKVLIKRRADSSIKNKVGMTAFQIAKEKGNIELMEMFPSPLMVKAAAEGNISTMFHLLDNKADINFVTEDGDTALLKAAMNGHADIARLLVQIEADVTVKNKAGKSALHVASENEFKDIAYLLSFPIMEAAANGNIDKLADLIKEGACVDFVDEDGNSALMRAASIGSWTGAELLIKHGAKIAVRNKAGESAFSLAKAGGHKTVMDLFPSSMMVEAAAAGNVDEVLRLLDEAGADINHVDEEGDTALLKACEKGHLSVTKLLIKRKADCSVKNEESKKALRVARDRGHAKIVASFFTSFLIESASNGRTEAVMRMIEEGADLNSINEEDGETALMKAARQGHVEVVRLLVQQHAFTGFKNKEGKTAVHIALECGHAVIVAEFTSSLSTAIDTGLLPEVVRKLDEGADVNSSVGDLNGCTPLIRACKNGQSAIASLLLDRGAAVNLSSKSNHTPLLWAIWNSHSSIALDLIEKGADVNMANEDGWTPLLCASWKGLTNVTSMILMQGADTEAQCSDGESALIKAAINGHSEIVSLLIKHKANLEFKRKKDTKTALQLAKESGHTKAVFALSCLLIPATVSGDENALQLLLDEGADINYIDEEGFTALLRATENSHKNICSLLVRRGADTAIANKANKTALRMAIETGQTAIAYTLSLVIIEAASKNNVTELIRLINDGAFINCTSETGETALMRAVNAGSIEAAHILIKRGADTCTMTNKAGKTAYKIAKEKKNTNIVNLFVSPLLAEAAAIGALSDIIRLIKDGADIDMPYEDGDTPLMKAADNGHVEVVRQLIQRKANHSAVNKKFKTALQLARAKNHAAIVYLLSFPVIDAARKNNIEEIDRLLSEDGADINYVNENGESALMVASAAGHTELVRLLLLRKAVASLRNKESKSALNLARENEHKEITSMLSFPLIEAAATGNMGDLIQLLDDGAELDFTDEKGETAMMKATTSNHVDVVRVLIERGANTRLTNQESRTALQIAREKGFSDLVQVLSHALIDAAIRGNEDEVQSMLLQGADSQYVDKAGYTALMKACEFNHYCVAVALINISNGSLTAKDKQAFLIARKNGNPDMMKLFTSRLLVEFAEDGDKVEVVKLMEEGANVNHMDMAGCTALSKAAERGDVDMVRLLLKLGADLSIRNKNGKTPLQLAKDNNHHTVVDMLSFPLISAAMNGDNHAISKLLDEGANENYVDEEGETALIKASRNGHLEIVSALIAIKCDTGLKNKAGKTAIEIAQECGHESIVSLFPTTLGAAIEAGYLSEIARMLDVENADVNSTVGDYNRWTPLIRATRSARIEVVKLLLERGADVNVAISNNHTALQWAAINDCKEIASLLLDNGANINVASENGWTPLICAVWNGHLDMASLLLDRGATPSINTADKEGKTALAWARYKDYTDVINLLISRGAK